MSETRPTKDTEIEAKLAIRSADPAGVMETVARLGAVAGYRLLPLPTVRIRDSYLELPGGGRGAGGGGAAGGEDAVGGEADAGGEADGGDRMALRRREVDGRAFLTLKGEAEGEAAGAAAGAADRAAGGVTRRLEIEVPEDEAGWRRIRGALGEAGIRVGAGLASLDELRPFQVRETLRLRRAVVPVGAGGALGSRAVTGNEAPGHPPDSIAELTLDTVTLEVLGRRVRFREVEVEARPGQPDPARQVADVGTGLRHAIGPDLLRPWALSKLATGMALERMAEAEELDRLVGENGDLLPEGLDRLEGFRG